VTPSDPKREALAQEVLRHPGMANTPSVRAAVVPGISALATASGLARVMDGVCAGSKILSRHHMAQMRRAAAVEESSLFGTRRWGLGFQVSPCIGRS
jgi:hypothetical protein